MSELGRVVRATQSAIRSANSAKVQQIAINNKRESTLRSLQEAVVGDEFILKGRTRFTGRGYASVAVNFPITFTAPPILMTAGYEPVKGAELQDDDYPLVDCGVKAWGFDGSGAYSPDTNTDGLNIRVWYTGAIIAITVDRENVLDDIWVHWMFSGPALVNPFKQSISDQAISGIL